MQFEDFALLLQKDNRLNETQKQWPRRNGQEAKTEKKWLISQGQEEMAKKPRPRRNG